MQNPPHTHTCMCAWGECTDLICTCAAFKLCSAAVCLHTLSQWYIYYDRHLYQLLNASLSLNLFLLHLFSPIIFHYFYLSLECLHTHFNTHTHSPTQALTPRQVLVLLLNYILLHNSNSVLFVWKIISLKQCTRTLKKYHAHKGHNHYIN